MIMLLTKKEKSVIELLLCHHPNEAFSNNVAWLDPPQMPLGQTSVLPLIFSIDPHTKKPSSVKLP